MAGNWTAAMKARSEFKEVVDSIKWENGNLVTSIEVHDSVYFVKTQKCKFKADFDYQKDDPEGGMKRTLRWTCLAGESPICSEVVSSSRPQVPPAQDALSIVFRGC